MSDADNQFEVCPKCGYKSANTEVCEACGVIFERIRGRRSADPDDSAALGEADFHDNIYRPAHGEVEPAGSGYGRILLMALTVALCVGTIGWYVYQRWSDSPAGLIKRHRVILTKAIDIISLPASGEAKARGLDECLDRTARLRDRILKQGKPGTVAEAQKMALIMVANEAMRKELEAASDALAGGAGSDLPGAPMAVAGATLDLAEQPQSKSAVERVNAVLKPIAPGAARTMQRSQKLFDQRASDVREAEEFSATPQDREQAVKDFDQRFAGPAASPVPPTQTKRANATRPADKNQTIIESARRDARKFIENIHKNPFADVTTSAPVNLYP